MSGAAVLTSTSGVATVGAWVLGATAGTKTLIVRAANLPDVTFSATATAGAAATVTAESQANLGDLVVSSAQAAPQMPSVRVTDALGNPVAGVTVTFAPGSVGSGTITGAVQTTNATGVATLASWTLPTATGLATVVAQVAGLTGVTFVANMLPGAASKVVLLNAPPPSAAAGTPLAVSVRLQDQFSNNVIQSGVAIGFAVAGTGGTVSAASVNTVAGIAQVTWTIGTAGAQTLTITSTGLSAPAPLSVTIVP